MSDTTTDQKLREFLESVGMGYYIHDPDDISFTMVQYIGSPVFEQDLEKLKNLLASEINKARIEEHKLIGWSDKLPDEVKDELFLKYQEQRLKDLTSTLEAEE